MLWSLQPLTGRRLRGGHGSSPRDSRGPPCHDCRGRQAAGAVPGCPARGARPGCPRGRGGATLRWQGGRRWTGGWPQEPGRISRAAATVHGGTYYGRRGAFTWTCPPIRTSGESRSGSTSCTTSGFPRRCRLAGSPFLQELLSRTSSSLLPSGFLSAITCSGCMCCRPASWPGWPPGRCSRTKDCTNCSSHSFAISV